MNQHSAIVFTDKVIVIADNTFYGLFNGLQTSSRRRSTRSSALNYLNTNIKKFNKQSKNSRASNVYTEMHKQSNGARINENQVQFVDASISRGIYNVDELILVPSNVNNQIIPEQQPTIAYDGSSTDIEIIYDGKSFKGDLKVVIDVITVLHSVNK